MDAAVMQAGSGRAPSSPRRSGTGTCRRGEALRELGRKEEKGQQPARLASAGPPRGRGTAGGGGAGGNSTGNVLYSLRPTL